MSSDKPSPSITLLTDVISDVTLSSPSSASSDDGFDSLSADSEDLGDSWLQINAHHTSTPTPSEGAVSTIGSSVIADLPSDISDDDHMDYWISSDDESDDRRVHRDDEDSNNSATRLGLVHSAHSYASDATATESSLLDGSYADAEARDSDAAELFSRNIPYSFERGGYSAHSNFIFPDPTSSVTTSSSGTIGGDNTPGQSHASLDSVPNVRFHRNDTFWGPIIEGLPFDDVPFAPTVESAPSSSEQKMYDDILKSVDKGIPAKAAVEKTAKVKDAARKVKSKTGYSFDMISLKNLSMVFTSLALLVLAENGVRRWIETPDVSTMMDMPPAPSIVSQVTMPSDTTHADLDILRQALSTISSIKDLVAVPQATSASASRPKCGSDTVAIVSAVVAGTSVQASGKEEKIDENQCNDSLPQSCSLSMYLGEPLQQFQQFALSMSAIYTNILANALADFNRELNKIIDLSQSILNSTPVKVVLDRTFRGLNVTRHAIRTAQARTLKALNRTVAEIPIETSDVTEAARALGQSTERVLFLARSAVDIASEAVRETVQQSLQGGARHAVESASGAIGAVCDRFDSALHVVRDRVNSLQGSGVDSVKQARRGLDKLVAGAKELTASNKQPDTPLPFVLMRDQMRSHFHKCSREHSRSTDHVGSDKEMVIPKATRGTLWKKQRQSRSLRPSRQCHQKNSRRWRRGCSDPPPPVRKGPPVPPKEPLSQRFLEMVHHGAAQLIR